MAEKKKSSAGTIGAILGASVGLIGGWILKLITGFKRR